jgi:hypothetical protein
MNMRFKISYDLNIEHRTLKYIEEDCSFDMEPIFSEIDFELILNKVSLAVLNSRIIQLSGFCGLSNSMKSDCQVPPFRKGVLSIQKNLTHGFAYGLNDVEFPVQINTESGWVCIGDPKISNEAVEFIDNCVAVINEKEAMVALWLKPVNLPSYLLK